MQRFVSAESDLLVAALSAKFSIVQKLDISHNSHISGKLIILVDHRFPSLNALILSDCGLNSRDLKSLAQASANSKLPELRHLDLSQNSDIQGQLENLFSSQEKWSNLLFLNIQQDSNSLSMNDVGIIFDFVRSGCLSSLTQLQACITHVIPICDYLDSPWRSLTALRITLVPNSSCTMDELLGAILKGVENKLFPKLRQIWLIDYKKAFELTDSPNEQMQIYLLSRCLSSPMDITSMLDKFPHIHNRYQWSNAYEIAQRAWVETLILNRLKRNLETVEPVTEVISNFTFLRQCGVHVYVLQSDLK